MENCTLHRKLSFEIQMAEYWMTAVISDTVVETGRDRSPTGEE